MNHSLTQQILAVITIAVVTTTFAGVICLSLIPLYLPTDDFIVSTQNSTISDILSLRMSINDPTNSVSSSSTVDTDSLAKSIDTALGFDSGTTQVLQASFESTRLDRTRRRVDRQITSTSDGDFIQELIVYFRLKYPSTCRQVTFCQQQFRSRAVKLLRSRKSFSLSSIRIDEQIISLLVTSTSLTENTFIPQGFDALTSFINRLRQKLNAISMDSILYWNLVAVEANGYDFDKTLTSTPEQAGPTLTTRAFAIIHGAMYNAYTEINRRPSTGLTNEQRSARSKLAIMEAAYQSLSRLYSKQRLIFDVIREDFIRRITSSAVTLDSLQEAISVGMSVSITFIRLRENDGNANPATYQPKSERGYHQVDPLHPKQGFLAPKWGEVTPFVLSSGSQLRLPTSIGLDSASRLAYLNSPKFRTDYDEVKALGAKVTPNRTADQEEYSIFWAYDGSPKIGLPPRLYNQVVRVIALQQRNTLEQNARLFAMVNYAMADAGIACWDTKYAFELWRPIVAIRNGTQSIPADPTWEPLGAPASGLGTDFTPNFPSYSSGHAVFGSSMFEIVRLFYGRDNIAFSFQSDEFNGKTIDSRTGLPRPVRTRSYQSLSQAEEENTLARIYLGIHWRIDQEDGQELGRRVGRYVFNNFNLVKK